MRIVVQETANSTGKGASKATSVMRGVVAGTSLASLLAAAPLHAQIVGAPNVPGNLRPTVLVAPNGVPLVTFRRLRRRAFRATSTTSSTSAPTVQS
ncbi:hypothetical protein [Variovorax durovernensis]